MSADPTIHWPVDHLTDRDLPEWGWRSSCIFGGWLALMAALGTGLTWLLLRWWSHD